MITIEIDQTAAPEEERLEEALLLSVQDSINQFVPDLPEGPVAAAYISEEAMQDLNRTYRGKDKVTDVLSFSYVGDPYSETLGDVVISVDQARRQAQDGLRTELVTLLVHGVLHVLGYDHEDLKDAEIMLPLQDKIVEHVL